MSGDSAEDIKKHVRVYITVFVAWPLLLALTFITVGISYLHLPTHWAILFALLVATTEGTLVACYFMHLISERKLIYMILLLCAFFFAVLMWAPVATAIRNEPSKHGGPIDSRQPPRSRGRDRHLTDMYKASPQHHKIFFGARWDAWRREPALVRISVFCLASARPAGNSPGVDAEPPFEKRRMVGAEGVGRYLGGEHRFRRRAERLANCAKRPHIG